MERKRRAPQEQGQQPLLRIITGDELGLIRGREGAGSLSSRQQPALTQLPRRYAAADVPAGPEWERVQAASRW